jgi:large conductance mechanosensitive channel
MGIVKEFKEFAMKGNVLDMAVGIIIGAAFGKIVSSFVSDIMMPPLGVLTGGVSFSEKKFVLKDGVAANPVTGAAEVPAVTLNYGLFLDVIINFLIVAFAVFLLVKGINTLRRKEEAAPAPPPGPTREEVLLTEIRDALVRR